MKTIGLLVRVSRSTRRRVVTATGDRQDLWDYMAEQPCIAIRQIDIAACGGPRRREARKGVGLEVRAATVDLAAPGKRPRGTPTLSMMAVSVTEPDPPADREPLDWMLLTTEGDTTAACALKVVSWYERRWLIEEFFKALKVGTRIEDRRLDEADDLRKCLAFDAITACRVMTIERFARCQPGKPDRRSRRDHGRQHSQGPPSTHVARAARSRPDDQSLRRRCGTPDRLHSKKTPTPAGNRETLAGIQTPPQFRRNLPNHAGNGYAQMR